MALTYGYVRCKVISTPRLQSKRHKQEIQYHLHATLRVGDEGGGTVDWDTAINVGTNDADDHNDVWQDGGILVNLGQPEWAGYFTAFTQQQVPTDRLGNPQEDSHPIEDSDPGSLAG
jgi:hypothetical protein